MLLFDLFKEMKLNKLIKQMDGFNSSNDIPSELDETNE